MLTKFVTGVVTLSMASAATAQWVPGMEITGQEVQVQTNGILNTITFSPNGVAQIRSPSGATVVDATWTAKDGQLCLQTANAFDCYPYRAPFTARQPVDLISNCSVTSRWTALSTAVMPGERG
jgi:hypothetical protein